MKKVIYYFTGTGNSLRAAMVISKAMGGADLISVRNYPSEVPATDADVIGFVCPVYEWDIPGAMREFMKALAVNPNAYFFMVATYIAIHGRCFETANSILKEKGAKLSYGYALRCVASQCTAYNPLPPEKIMVPLSERKTAKIAKQIAAGNLRSYPHMGSLTRKLYPKLMSPYMRVESEYDKGFYTNEDCKHCEICKKVCPTRNITFEEGHPVWNHNCHGCMACVAYCPTKAIQFKTPPAYVALNTPISKKLGLPDKRKRYHNPYIKASDLAKDKQ